MCKNVENLKLCTCLIDGNINTIIHHKKSKKHKQHNYVWTLKRFISAKELILDPTGASVMDGMIILPDNMLEENLTNEKIMTELNKRNCFDFEYEPNEGDNLELRTNNVDYLSKWISFIFKNGQWTIDKYRFQDDLEKINLETFNLNKLQLVLFLKLT